jgi:DNA polymerase III delta prime subunit
MDLTILRSMTSRFPWSLSLSSLLSPRKPQPSVSVSTQTVPNSRPPSVKVIPPSPEEELQARREIARRDAEDWLESLVGQDNVKRRLNEIQTWISICQAQGKDPKQEWYNIVLEGNEGTGKTTVARIYANILFSTGITDMLSFREISGAALAAQGPEGLSHLISSMVDAASPSAQIAGVLLIEDAHLLITSSPIRSQEIFDGLFEAMERATGRVVVVLTGRPTHMEGLVRSQPRLERTTCCTLHFTDFTSNDYLTLLGQSLQERYNGKIDVAGGLDGPYMQMAARRLVRAAAGNGPRNVHAVQRLLDTVTLRQLQSLMSHEQGNLDEVDTFSFSPEDLLGPRPADVLAKSRAWADLQKLVGQKAVKASVTELLDTVEENYWRESRNQRPFSVRVNRIFVGPPGTGKSTVARLYGQVLADVGVLSSGEG